MKKLIGISLGIIFSVGINAADLDTTKINVKDAKILIVKSGDKKEINLSDSLVPKKPKRESHWAGFDIGVNGYFNSSGSLSLEKENEFLDLDYAKSILVNINPFEKYIPISGDRFGILTGLGFQFTNYDLDSDKRLREDRDSITAYRDTLNMSSVSKNKLKATYLTLPILFELNSKRGDKGFHFAAGMLFSYRLGSKNKMKYTTPTGNDRKDKYKDDYNLNPFGAAVTTRFGYSWLNLFATYNLTTLFEKNKGPELYPFTVGLTLLDF